MLSIFLFPSSRENPIVKQLPTLYQGYNGTTREKQRKPISLEEIIGKHSEENRQILHDKYRQQLSSQNSHLLTATARTS